MGILELKNFTPVLFIMTDDYFLEIQLRSFYSLYSFYSSETSIVFELQEGSDFPGSFLGPGGPCKPNWDIGIWVIFPRILGYYLFQIGILGYSKPNLGYWDIALMSISGTSEPYKIWDIGIWAL